MTTTVREYEAFQAAVMADQAVIQVDPVTARRLMVTASEPARGYIGTGTRWLFRVLGSLAFLGLAAGIGFLLAGHPWYGALAFGSALVVHYLWGGLATEMIRMIARRDIGFWRLAMSEGWISVTEPVAGPGRAPKPFPAAASTDDAQHEEEIARARAVLAARPDDAQTRFDLGVTYVLIGQFDLALEESRLLTMTDARLANRLQTLVKLLAR